MDNSKIIHFGEYKSLLSLAPTELVSSHLINELKFYLSEEEINQILKDIKILEFNNPLSEDKTYLNILFNLFLKYRVKPVPIDKLSIEPQFYLGLGLGLQNEFLLKFDKFNDDKDEIELIDYNIINDEENYSNLLSLKYDFFDFLAKESKSGFKKIDFDSENSIERQLDKAIPNNDLFGSSGLFYEYFGLKYESKKGKTTLPAQIDKKKISDAIDKCLRYYAWYNVFYNWNYYLNSLTGNNLEIENFTKIIEDYTILHWFFVGKESNINLFNTVTAYNYHDYVSICNNGTFNSFDPVIVEKLELNNNLTKKLEKLRLIVTSNIFCKENDCISPVISPFVDYFISENPLKKINEINDYHLIIKYYNKLKEFYTFCKLDFEKDNYSLNIDAALEYTIAFIVQEKVENKISLSMPFSTIWTPLSPEKAKNKSYYNFTKSDHLMEDFFLEFVNDGITTKNFENFINNSIKLSELQDKLIDVGDLVKKQRINITSIYKLEKHKEILSIEYLNNILKFNERIKSLVVILRRLWFQIILKNSLFCNDEFTKKFNITESRDINSIIIIFENYLSNWMDYKSNSKELQSLHEEIKTVSQLKYDLEGLKLVSRRFLGAISFIKAQEIMLKEKSRMIDVILKELVNIMYSYYYNDGIQIKIDLFELNSSTDDVVFAGAAIEIVEQVQIYKNQIITRSEKIQIGEIVIKFIEYSKVLLGNNFKLIQLSRFTESYQKWFIKLKTDTQLALVGMNIKNYDNYLKTLCESVIEMNAMITKFYQHSLEPEILNSIKIVSETKNLITLFSQMEKLNIFYSKLISELSEKLVNLQNISEKLIEITDEVFISYSDIINVNDFINGIEDSRVKHSKESGSVIITEVIKDTDSLLVKQLFIEKAFRLSIVLDYVFLIIEEQLIKDFRPVVMSAKYKRKEVKTLDISIDERLNHIFETIENIINFLKSIKMLSRRHIQTLKIFVYYTPRLLSKLEIKSILKPTIVTIIDSTNAYARKIKSLKLLKELNFHLNTFKRQVFAGYKSYLQDNVFEGKTVEQFQSAIKFETNEPIYTRNYLIWVKKIQLVLNMTMKELNTEGSIPNIEKQFDQIDVDKIQEDLLNLFILKDKNRAKGKKDKTLRTTGQSNVEAGLRKQIDILKSQVKFLEDQVNTLQQGSITSTTSRSNIVDALEASPLQIEEELTKYQQKSKLTNLISIEQEIKSEFSVDDEIFDDQDSDLIQVVVGAEETYNDDDDDDDDDYIDDDDLPALDLIKELRSVKNIKIEKLAKHVSDDKESNSEAKDIINEIEDFLEEEPLTNRSIISKRKSFAIPKPAVKLRSLIDEGTYDVTKIAGKFMPGLLPKQLLDSDEPSDELIKHKDNIKSLKTSLSEELHDYEETPTSLESLITEYAEDMFGDLDGETVAKDIKVDKKTKKKRSKRGIDEMEELLNFDFDDEEYEDM